MRGAERVVISSVEISVLAHATEDVGRVERAVLNMISEGAGGLRPRVERLSGYHGNPITRMSMRIRKRRAAMETLRKLVGSLSPSDRRMLVDEAEERVDEAGNLYLRLDKQSAYRGRAALHEADAIRMKFSFRVPHKVDPVRYVRDYLAGLVDELESESVDAGGG